MPNELQYDAFLSHSAQDKAVVRVPSLSASTGERAGVRCRSQLSAERLHAKAEVRRKKEEIELQPSAFRLQPLLRDPLNRERRFIPLRLDDAPIKGCPGAIPLHQLAPGGPRAEICEWLETQISS